VNEEPPSSETSTGDDVMDILAHNKSRWNAETIQRLLDEKKPSVIELEGEEEVQEDA
jgi:hypothetical protein